MSFFLGETRPCRWHFFKNHFRVLTMYELVLEANCFCELIRNLRLFSSSDDEFSVGCFSVSGSMFFSLLGLYLISREENICKIHKHEKALFRLFSEISARSFPLGFFPLIAIFFIVWVTSVSPNISSYSYRFLEIIFLFFFVTWCNFLCHLFLFSSECFSRLFCYFSRKKFFSRIKIKTIFHNFTFPLDISSECGEIRSNVLSFRHAKYQCGFIFLRSHKSVEKSFFCFSSLRLSAVCAFGCSAVSEHRDITL